MPEQHLKQLAQNAPETKLVSRLITGLRSDCLGQPETDAPH